MNSNEGNHLGSIKCTQNPYTNQPNMQAQSMTQPYAQPIVKTGSFAFFRAVCLPSILFALLITFCRYNNEGTILDPVWAAGALGYILFTTKKLHQPWNKKMIFPSASLLLFSISNMLTGNPTIILMNSLACDLLVILISILAFYPNQRWQIGQWIAAGCSSICGSIGALGDWGQDLSEAIKQRNKNSHIIQIIVGLSITLPLTVIIIMLLASADSVFRSMVIDLFQFDFWEIITKTMMFAFFYFGSYCGIRFLNKKRTLIREENAKKHHPLTAYIILLPITAVYILFSWIQFAYLMIGNMTLPEGMTYAKYAHQGFNQLLAVVIINLMIVLFTVGFFGRNKMLKTILSLFTACTYVMIASAFIRIFMYIGVYHLTELRFLVVWGLSVVSLLFAIVFIYIFSEKFHMARWFFVVGTLGCLALSYCRMDAIIAKYNITMIHSLSEAHAIDEFVDYDKRYDLYYNDGEEFYVDESTDYLANLSTDAADVIYNTGNEKLIKAYSLRNDYAENDVAYSWKNTNLSYEHFLKLK